MGSSEKKQENNLETDVATDGEFLDSAIDVVFDQDLTVEPQERKQLLKLVYARARRLLMEAQKYRTDGNCTSVTLAEWETVPKVQKKIISKLLGVDEKNDIIANQKPDMPMPSTTGPCPGLMLPPWRQCKLGPTAILKAMKAPPRSGVAVRGMPRFHCFQAPPMGAPRIEHFGFR